MKAKALAKICAANSGSLDDCIRDTCKRRMNEDAFYICDVNDIIRKQQTWTKNLPRVRPFYAVKCNNSQMVLEILNSFGIGFDCASKVSSSSSSLSSSFAFHPMRKKPVFLVTVKLFEYF